VIFPKLSIRRLNWLALFLSRSGRTPMRATRENNGAEMKDEPGLLWGKDYAGSTPSHHQQTMIPKSADDSTGGPNAAAILAFPAAIVNTKMQWLCKDRFLGVEEQATSQMPRADPPKSTVENRKAPHFH
jgi:hypothetical protein